MDNYEAFRQRLVQARKEAGFTQVEVSAKLDKPQSYLSKCECGERRLDVVELAKLAKLYDKPLNYFVNHVE